MNRPILVLVFCALAAVSATALTPAMAQTVNCSGVAAWSGNSVSYAVGALVTYGGDEYKCLQAHTSEAGWDPPAVPALWSLVGTCAASRELRHHELYGL